MLLWFVALTSAGLSLISVECASIPEQMLSNPRDTELNPGGMGLPGYNS